MAVECLHLKRFLCSHELVSAQELLVLVCTDNTSSTTYTTHQEVDEQLLAQRHHAVLCQLSSASGVVGL